MLRETASNPNFNVTRRRTNSEIDSNERRASLNALMLDTFNGCSENNLHVESIKKHVDSWGVILQTIALEHNHFCYHYGGSCEIEIFGRSYYSSSFPKFNDFFQGSYQLIVPTLEAWISEDEDHAQVVINWNLNHKSSERNVSVLFSDYRNLINQGRSKRLTFRNDDYCMEFVEREKKWQERKPWIERGTDMIVGLLDSLSDAKRRNND